MLYLYFIYIEKRLRHGQPAVNMLFSGTRVRMEDNDEGIISVSTSLPPPKKHVKHL